MSVLRALGASALSLLVPASFLLVAPPGSATVTPRAHARHADGQPGGAAADRPARWPGGQRPTRRRRPSPPRSSRSSSAVQVSLQVQRGSSWQTVATVSQDRNGRAQFAARASVDGRGADLPGHRGRRRGPPGGRRAARSAPSAGSPRPGPTSSPATRSPGAGPTAGGPTSRRASAAAPGGAPRRSGSAVAPCGSASSGTRSRHALCPALKNGQIAGRYAYRLNGHIGTDNAFSFRYGVAAARIKYPRLRGQHGSFWMQPVGGMSPGGTGHEIDVTEFFGADPATAAASSATSTATRAAASSRPAPTSPTRSSTARATAGGRTSTSSPCSGRRGG